MFGLSTETVSRDGSSSPDDSASGVVIDVSAIEDDDDNSVDDASSMLLSEYLSTHRRPVSLQWVSCHGFRLARVC